MRHLFAFNRGLMALAITLVFGMTTNGFIASTVAQEPEADVNAVMVCPPGLGNAEIDPDDCTEPGAGIEFFIANHGTDNVEFGTVGGDGLISFPLDRFAISPEGALVDVGMLVESNPVGPITGHVVSCNQNGEPFTPETTNTVVNPGGTALTAQFTVFEGDQLSCEWFLSHHTGDSGDSDDGTVGELPGTGTGSGPSANTFTYAPGLAVVSVLTIALAILVRRPGTQVG